MGPQLREEPVRPEREHPRVPEVIPGGQVDLGPRPVGLLDERKALPRPGLLRVGAADLQVAVAGLRPRGRHADRHQRPRRRRGVRRLHGRHELGGASSPRRRTAEPRGLGFFARVHTHHTSPNATSRRRGYRCSWPILKHLRQALHCSALGVSKPPVSSKTVDFRGHECAAQAGAMSVPSLLPFLLAGFRAGFGVAL